MVTERRSEPSWRRGFRPIAPLAGLWLAGSAFLAILVGQEAIPYADLLLDPAQYDRRPWYTGLISNVGILGWTVAAVAAAGGGWVAGLGHRDRAAELLRGGALLSGLLLLDDLFQFHIIVPRTIGAPKMAFYAFYGALGLAWAHSNRSEFVRTRWPLLIAALVALAGSASIDVIGDGRSTALLAEDSAKFLGILAWALFFVLTTGDICRSIVRQGERMMENDDESKPTVLAYDPDESSRSTTRRKKPKSTDATTTDGSGDPSRPDTSSPAANAGAGSAVRTVAGVSPGGTTATTGTGDGARSAAPIAAADRAAATPASVDEAPAVLATVRTGPSRARGGVDPLAAGLRAVITFWLPVALLCALCGWTVALMFGM